MLDRTCLLEVVQVRFEDEDLRWFGCEQMRDSEFISGWTPRLELAGSEKRSERGREALKEQDDWLWPASQTDQTFIRQGSVWSAKKESRRAILSQRASPLSHVGLHHCFRRHLPRAVDPSARQPLEIKLAADLGVRPAGVRHVVAVEGHHVTKDVRARSSVCQGRDTRCNDAASLSAVTSHCRHVAISRLHRPSPTGFMWKRRIKETNNYSLLL